MIQKTNNIFLLTCILLTTTFANGQPIRLNKQSQDSLWKCWSNSKSVDSTRLKSIDKLIYSLIMNNKDSSLKLIDLEQKFALKKQNYKYIGGSYFIQAYFALSEGAFNKAEKLYKIALKNYQKINFYPGISSSYNGIGNCFMSKSDYVNGIDNYIEASKIYLKAGDKKGYALTMANVGSVFYFIEDYDQAYSSYLKSLTVFIELNETRDVAKCYDDLGTCIQNFNDSLCLKYKIKPSDKLGRALIYYQKCLNISLKDENSEVLANCFKNIGSINLIQGNLDTAEIYINKAIKTALNNNDEVSLASSYRYLSEVYYKYFNYNLAIDFSNKSFALAKKMELIDLQKQDYEILYNCYKATGDKEHALINLENYILIKDSLSEDEKDKQIIKKLYQFEYDKKEMLAKAEQEKIESIRLGEKQKQNIITYSIIGVLLLVGLFTILIYKRFRVTQRQNEIISKQKQVVESKNHIIEEKQKEIVDSINYAKRIQVALLANQEFVNQFIPSNFVLFKPKDIVSGDFYWATEHNNKFYLAVCDCTGHGVPGAFMSLLNIGFLSEAIKEKNIEQPHEIFNYVRSRLINTISKEGQQDGMDGILLCLDKATNQYTYAAANNEPILISNNEVKELSKDKMPVGKGEKIQSFTLQTINANKGDTLYLYTDGYADQFGGAKGKKFKYKALNDLLLANVNQPMAYQNKHLNNTIEQWRGNLEQVDDVLVIGIKI